MTEAEYRIKYLKYKQKYTNALHNMQGGEELLVALGKQPKVVIVVDDNTFNKLKISYPSLKAELPPAFDEKTVTETIKKLKPNAIRILPMTPFKKESTKKSYGFIKVGKNETVYKDGLEKVDGSPIQGGENVPFSGKNFGQITQKSTTGASTNKYDGNTALNHLKEIKNLFSSSWGLGDNPSVVVFVDKTLYLCSIPA
jgi:hypothetical protein